MLPGGSAHTGHHSRNSIEPSLGTDHRQHGTGTGVAPGAHHEARVELGLHRPVERDDQRRAYRKRPQQPLGDQPIPRAPLLQGYRLAPRQQERTLRATNLVCHGASMEWLLGLWSSSRAPAWCRVRG